MDWEAVVCEKRMTSSWVKVAVERPLLACAGACWARRRLEREEQRLRVAWLDETLQQVTVSEPMSLSCRWGLVLDDARGDRSASPGC